MSNIPTIIPTIIPTGQTDLQILKGEMLGPYTTYGIGGPARYFAKANTLEDLASLIEWARAGRLPVFILGKGSNILFDDRGFNGLVIQMRLCQMNLDPIEGKVVAGAGFSFARLGTLCSQEGLKGLEFASGIPGSVGGAVYMNAGASGSDTAEVLSKVRFLDAGGKLLEYQREELLFSYRESPFQHKKGIIIDAEFILKKDPSAKESQKQMLQKRILSQPYDQKSAGCVFRNPTSSSSEKGSLDSRTSIQSAGALIDQAGLKGYSIGGMEVSNLHANFLINRGNGKAVELLALIAHIRAEVAKQFHVELQLEIRKVDFEPTTWWVT